MSELHHVNSSWLTADELVAILFVIASYLSPPPPPTDRPQAGNRVVRNYFNPIFSAPQLLATVFLFAQMWPVMITFSL
jgi:hypothetical protein